MIPCLQLFCPTPISIRFTIGYHHGRTGSFFFFFFEYSAVIAKLKNILNIFRVEVQSAGLPHVQLSCYSTSLLLLQLLREAAKLFCCILA